MPSGKLQRQRQLPRWQLHSSSAQPRSRSWLGGRRSRRCRRCGCWWTRARRRLRRPVRAQAPHAPAWVFRPALQGCGKEQHLR